MYLEYLPHKKVEFQTILTWILAGCTLFFFVFGSAFYNVSGEEGGDVTPSETPKESVEVVEETPPPLEPEPEPEIEEVVDAEETIPQNIETDEEVQDPPPGEESTPNTNTVVVEEVAEDDEENTETVTESEEENESTENPSVGNILDEESTATTTSLNSESITSHEDSLASSTIHNVLSAEDEGEENVTATTTDEVLGEVAQDTEGEAVGGGVVETGDAIATADVVNVVNTNIIDSEGLFLLIRNLFSPFEFDLRGYDVFSENAECNEACASKGDLSVDIENDAVIENDITLFANTGENTASGTSSVIQTGDAYAHANVLNIANTNIVDSNYLLLSFNNIGDWIGDLILPARHFFEEIWGTSGGTSNAHVAHKNDAEVENNVTVIADTGSNTVAGDGSVVETGDGTAHANVLNQVNTNLYNEDSMLFLFRVHGNWTGNVYGLPQGVNWVEGDDGVYLLGTGLHDAENKDAGGSGVHNTSVETENSAQITNNINVFALTGDNKAEGDDSVVSTGNAYAQANIINVANTNVVGRNWLLAIFDVFGDWNGDISFGKPDLWVGTRAVPDYTPLTPGHGVDYHYTIMNKGDADATGVTLSAWFKNGHLVFSGVDASARFENHERVTWNIGTIPAGEYKEVTYHAEVASGISYGDNPLEVFAGVSSNEPEQDEIDNTDVVVVTSSKLRSYGTWGGNTPLAADPVLTVTKEGSATTTKDGVKLVDYEVEVTNTGGPAYKAILSDFLLDQEARVLHEEHWDLETIATGETIYISYTVDFGTSTVFSTYTNRAGITAMGGSAEDEIGNEVFSNIAESVIHFESVSEEPLSNELVEAENIVEEDVALDEVLIIPETVEIEEVQEVVYAPPFDPFSYVQRGLPIAPLSRFPVVDGEEEILHETEPQVALVTAFDDVPLEKAGTATLFVFVGFATFYRGRKDNWHIL